MAEMMASGQPLPGGGQGLAGNMLVRSLGAGPAVEVEIHAPHPQAGRHGAALLRRPARRGERRGDQADRGRETPEKGARKLIDLANARGGPDNISVVIARVPGAAAVAPAARQVLPTASPRWPSRRWRCWVCWR
ncbi:MAG: hypothetical protein V9H69_22515 [Anaerolineae bacterium]